MTSSQKPVDDIICSGVTPFLLFSQYGILYAGHQNIFPFRKLLFYSAQYFPVSEAKPHKPQLHFGLHLGAVCGSCGMRHSFMLPSVGQKKSEPTHYHMYQFAQNNTDSDVLQSLSSAKRSPVYHTFAVFCSIKNHAHLHQTVLLVDILQPHHPNFHKQFQLTFRMSVFLF